MRQQRADGKRRLEDRRIEVVPHPLLGFTRRRELKAAQTVRESLAPALAQHRALDAESVQLFENVDFVFERKHAASRDREMLDVHLHVMPHCAKRNGREWQALRYMAERKNRSPRIVRVPCHVKRCPGNGPTTRFASIDFALSVVNAYGSSGRNTISGWSASTTSTLIDG